MSNVNLNRAQLAKFLPNPQAIKAFEELFVAVSDGLPSKLEDSEAAAGLAQQQAGEALAGLAGVANLLLTSTTSAADTVDSNQLADVSLEAGTALSKANEALSSIAEIERDRSAKNYGIVSVKEFEHLATTSGDWTMAIQAALNELEMIGGGILFLPPGLYYVSLANSANQYACVVVPKNIVFMGAGMGATIIQRLPSERGVNGVLIVNKNWDTAGGYAADGNIVFRDFTITDGAASPQRALGDLIGLGHADNCTVHRVEFGNHDQHAVDICGSRRISIRDCVGFNETSGGYTASATVQIDGVAAGAVYGIFVDSTPSREVNVSGCNFVNKSSTILLHVGHKPQLFSRIVISDNVFDGGYLSGSNIIACDSNVSLEHVSITGNKLICNNGNARCLNFFVVGNTSETLNNVVISHNTMSGASRIAVFAGSNNTYAGGAYPKFRGLVITDNAIDIVADAAVSTVTGIHVAGWLSASVANNIVNLRQASDSSIVTYGIFVNRNQSIVVNGNTISKEIASPTFANNSSAIYVEATFPNVGKASINVTNNMIVADGWKHLINMPGSGNLTANVDSVLISGNVLAGTPNYPSGGSHIYEKWACSDGTNFRSQVDFGSGSYIKTLGAGQFYNALPLCGVKRSSTDSILSPAIIKLVYAPLSTNFDAEEIQVAYISETSCVGVQVADINQTAGTFSILTGNSGTTMIINNTNFQPVLRTGGYLKAFTSI